MRTVVFANRVADASTVKLLSYAYVNKVEEALVENTWPGNWKQVHNKLPWMFASCQNW